MYSVWTKHLTDDEQKQQFENSLQGSKAVLNRAIAILKEEEAQLTAAELSHKIYDTPNWSHKMAHDNGFKAALRTVIRLLDLDQQTKGQ
jgi:hypothetical protein